MRHIDADYQPASPRPREGSTSIIPFGARADRHEKSIELTRKSIHLLIAFVPLLLGASKILTLVLLSGGMVFYAVSEILRRKGIEIPLISRLTVKAARLRDRGKFVKGPLTLGAGALLSVLLFRYDPARIAIYVLAFGDGLSSLVGKFYGRIRIPLTGGKSLGGSLTCFAVSFAASVAISGRYLPSLAVAAVSTLVEALPLKDWDNIALPFCAGLVATLLGL